MVVSPANPDKPKTSSSILSVDSTPPRQVKKNAAKPKTGEITIKQNQPKAWANRLGGG